MGSAAVDNANEQVFQTALSAFRAGRLEEARRTLTPLAAARVGTPQVHRLMAMIQQAAGDNAGEERALRVLLQLQPDDANVAAALAANLLRSARGGEGLAILEPFAAVPDASYAVLTLLAASLAAIGRNDEAVAAGLRACTAAPYDPIAYENIARLLCDVERFDEAEAAARHAMALSADTSSVWTTLGRALHAQNQVLAAEQAFEEALTRNPIDENAHIRRASSIWMRTGDAAAATSAIDAALGMSPGAWRLVVHKASIVEAAEGPSAAYALLDRAAIVGADPRVHLAAARTAVLVDSDFAVAHLQRAEGAGLCGDAVDLTWCEAWLGLGEAERAAERAQRVLDRAPANQRALTLAGTARRLLGLAQTDALFDYDRLVFAAKIETPSGWSDLATYLRDLENELLRLHQSVAAPAGQSLRGGSQTGVSLLQAKSPAVRAFFPAAERVVAEYRTWLGAGDDPLRARNLGRTRIAGSWSSLLGPGGFHVSHMHSDGWLSSAFYVALPDSNDEGGKEGWLGFGQPDVPTRPALNVERFIKPEPGLLVLFPSYVPHGTIPFCEGRRLTIAFDVVPLP